METIRQIDRRNAAADLFFKVNANIYIEEAKSIGTNLQVEVFESVLDEESDVKNMVMYMVAQTIGDIPLEVKWWTGRMDANGRPIRELGEMAIADWGDSHRNTTERNQTKRTSTDKHTRHYTPATTHMPPHICHHTHTDTSLPVTQVLTGSPPHPRRKGDLLQRAHRRRNLQNTEDREGQEGRPRQQGERQGEREGRRSRTTRPRKGGELLAGNTRTQNEPPPTKPHQSNQREPPH